MTTFGWITEQFGERMSVLGIGLVLIATAALVMASHQWIEPAQADKQVSSESS